MGNRAVSHLLVRPLETLHVPSGALPQADAIVVLGGVTWPAMSPQPTTHLNAGADRLTYSAELYQAHKAPLVVLSGGVMPWNKGLAPESAQMCEVMQMLGVPRKAILQESTSRNTHENAAYTSRLLLAHHLHKALLVTSAMAMPRALDAFRHEGVDAIPAPTDFRAAQNSRSRLSRMEVDALNLVPDPRTLEESTAAIHEYVGLVLYRVAGWI
jgi:uncharacterized SAM-binding protein YcdF (DUF218 family)